LSLRQLLHPDLDDYFHHITGLLLSGQTKLTDAVDELALLTLKTVHIVSEWFWL